MFVITISRQTGSLGDEIALLLSEKSGIKLITHDFVMADWLPEVASSHELRMLEESPKFFLKHSDKAGETFQKFIESKIKEHVASCPIIIKGVGSQFIFRGSSEALNVRIIASDKTRTERIARKYNMDGHEAKQFIDLSDRKHRRFISTLYGSDWSQQNLYDITINTDFLTINEAVDILANASEIRKKCKSSSLSQNTVHLEIEGQKYPGYSLENDIMLSITKPEQSLLPIQPEQPAQLPAPQKYAFKHPSEEEFSKILDMYNIQWLYEPKTFPIQWDNEGNVTMAFTPDFFLPRFNTYIELTTMNQKYVTEKNKKVRRLKELYPGTNINIVFRNNYHTLIKRFGIMKEGSIKTNEKDK